MAYALISLVQILEQDQHHLFLYSKFQIESLLKEARLLKELVARSNGGIESLENGIREAAHRAEDIIEFHVRNQILSALEVRDSQFDLSDVMREFAIIKHRILQIVDGDKLQANPSPAVKGYDVNHLAQEAQTRWLKPAEIFFMLKNYEHQLTHQAPQNPTSGSLFLFNKQVVKDFRKDGHSWRRRRNQRSIHERLKVGNVEMLNCSYAHGEENTNFQRRSYWILDPLYQHIVLVHYREVSNSFATTQRPPYYGPPINAYEINPNSYPLSFGQRKLGIPVEDNICLPIAQTRKFTIEEIPPDLCNTSKGTKLAGDNGDEYGIFANDNSRGLVAASEMALGSGRNHNTAALSIQEKYRGWRDFLTLRQKIVKMQAQINNAKSDTASSSQDLSQIDDVIWESLRLKVFRQDSCPPELEVLGKKIAKACIDLPLAINLIAAFLSSSKYTQGLWELVESKVSSIETGGGIYFNILSVIYSHLPSHLKPCFLYIGAFPQNVEIRSSRIIKLWIAEGFVEPTEYSYEETAELYLEDLIGRNLLSVSLKELDGKVKAFEVDFYVKKFCEKKAREEDFLWFKDSREHGVLQDKERRVSVDPLSELTTDTRLMSLARSFLCIGPASLRLVPSFQSMKLLRVLDVFQLEFYQFPKEMLQLVLLRYLAFSCHSDLPSAISRFLNLQTLIIRRLPSSRAFTLPPGLWELTQLRHVKSKETCVWYFPRNGKDVLQENIQTLSNVHAFLLTSKFIGRIPNVTKLGIFCDSYSQTVIGLDRLQNLETLKCSASWSTVARDFLSYLKFPASLKKLTVSFCKLPCGFMTTVGSLPNLEELKLQNSDFLGLDLDPMESESEPIEPEWVPVEGEFLRLRSLLMKELNLVHWKAHANHFPSLQCLVIRDCCLMREIPLIIGSIRTLKLIEVDESSPSVLASAKQIKDERSLGNESLELIICEN